MPSVTVRALSHPAMQTCGIPTSATVHGLGFGKSLPFRG